MDVLRLFGCRRGRASQPVEGARERAPELPGCDDVFLRFFDRWYSEADRARKPFRATRPDAEVCAAPGTPVAGVAAVGPERARQVLEVVTRGMAEAARRDWPSPAGASDVEWLDAFDRHWTRARVRALLDAEDPSDPSNRVLVTCGELGAALGEALIARSPGCAWLAGWPYWESAVYDPRSGVRINVLHWAVKKLSETGVDGSLAAKVTATAALVASAWHPGQRGPGGAG